MAIDPLLNRSRSLREPNRRLCWGVSWAGGPSHCFSLEASFERPTNVLGAFQGLAWGGGGGWGLPGAFQTSQNRAFPGALPGASQGPPRLEDAKKGWECKNAIFDQ